MISIAGQPPGTVYKIHKIVGDINMGSKLHVTHESGAGIYSCDTTWFSFNNLHVCVKANKNLTVGKLYKIFPETAMFVNVFNDNDEQMTVDYSFFKEEWEVRMDKLKEIIAK